MTKAEVQPLDFGWAVLYERQQRVNRRLKGADEEFIRTFDCPQCSSNAPDACVSASGNPLGTSHSRRIRLAEKAIAQGA